MIRAKISGTGRSLPERVVTNDDLAEFLDTNDTWIKERTGIRQRRIAEKETLLELCEKAGRQAMAQAGIEAGALDMIIAATLTADDPLPNLSSGLQRVLGAERAVCFDLNAACSGFIFALTTAQMYIQSGQVKNVLVLGGEILSKIMDWTDRSTCVLFGDGAGAAVVGVTEGEEGILAVDLGSNGKKGGVLSLKGRPIENPFRKLSEEEGAGKFYVHMDGPEVFKFAVSQVPSSIRKLLKKSGKRAEDVDCFVLHQANLRIIHSVAKRLKVSEEKFFVNMESYGNTSAASVPIALDEGIRSGRIQKGDLIVLSGFGGGLTWGSLLIQI